MERVIFCQTYCIKGIYNYVQFKYNINFELIDALIISTCRVFKENKLKRIELVKFFYEIVKMFEISNEYFKIPFSYVKLQTSPIALDYDLVEMGIRCDYPMP